LPAQPYAIRWQVNAPPVAIEVEGLSRAVLSALERREQADAAWAELFAVFAEQPGDQAESPVGRQPRGMPAMAGAWSVTNGRLRFEPQFPLARGVRYRAEFRPEGAAVVRSFFELPADTTAP